MASGLTRHHGALAGLSGNRTGGNQANRLLHQHRGQDGTTAFITRHGGHHHGTAAQTSGLLASRGNLGHNFHNWNHNLASNWNNWSSNHGWGHHHGGGGHGGSGHGGNGHGGNGWGNHWNGNWGHHLHHGWNRGGGWGGWGWGGWGRGGWGLGWGYPYYSFGYWPGYYGTGFGWGYYSFPGLFASLLYGSNCYGGGYGTCYGTYSYDPYCGGGTYLSYVNSDAPTAVAVAPQAGAPASQDALALAQKPAPSETSSDAAENSRVFAEKGEADFRAGDYKAAAYAWKHAAVDDPENGLLALMASQALFAIGEYDKAAGALQVGMRFVPKDEWGVVIRNYKELYGKPGDYTTQLRALEKAIKDKPNDPAMRFLAGYHYAYLGYPKEAIDQLDKGLKAAPRDVMAKQLRDEMQAKLPKPAAVPTPPPPPAPGIDSRAETPAEPAGPVEE